MAESWSFTDPKRPLFGPDYQKKKEEADKAMKELRRIMEQLDGKAKDKRRRAMAKDARPAFAYGYGLGLAMDAGMRYRYIGTTSDGAVIRGTVDANSEQDAKSQLSRFKNVRVEPAYAGSNNLHTQT